MMPGVTLKEIQDGILDAYTEPQLEEVLRTQMNLRLDVEIEPGAWGYRVFKLVEWSEMQGRDIELVQVTCRARPRNAKMQQIYKKYGMAIPVNIQQAGSAVPDSPADAGAGGLEKIVRPHLSFADFGIWRERMTQVEGHVCMITLNGAPQGTGFLVGPDAVLTNYHVMEPVLKGAKKATDIECVFDFKKLSNSTVVRTPIALHHDWLLDATLYSNAEGEGNPDSADPTPEQLDYALVRLSDKMGTKPLAQSAVEGAPIRGWVSVPDIAAPFKSPMGIMIAQHPGGYPLKLAIDTDAINEKNNLWLNQNATRVRYATNTLNGSSGSPVFDLEWNLIALHHYGDPNWKDPKFNQGVPIGKIRDRLIGSGKAGALGGDPS